MRGRDVFIGAASVAFIMGGLLLHVWLVSIAGVFVFAMLGWWWAALVCACVLDLVYGPPVGVLHAAAFPIFICTLCVVLARAYLIRHIR